MDLSALLVVRNEEQLLPGALGSVADADEIVVVDTGSVDRTVAIARAFPKARVARHAWVDDFSRTKNFGISQCRGDWILSLDADERLRPGHMGLVMEAARSGGQAFALAIEEEAGGGTRPSLFGSPQARLFRREGARFEGRVFERLVAPAGGCGAAILHLWDARPAGVRALRARYYATLGGGLPGAAMAAAERPPAAAAREPARRAEPVPPREPTPRPFLTLLVGFYEDPSAERTAELRECLRRNAANPWVERVVAFVEDPRADRGPLRDPRIQAVEHGRRLVFDDLFRWANANLAGRTVAITNADVWYDGTLGRLASCDLAGKLLCLTRTEPSGRVETSGYSQDTWVFRAPIRDFPRAWQMGKLGCDSVLSHSARAAGLEVLNPCRTVRAWHMHGSMVRRYSQEDRIRGEYLDVPFCEL